MPKKKSDTIIKKSLIKEALGDINSEILNINKEKKNLNDQIQNADKNLENFRNFEKRLQQKIAALLEREAILKENKKAISLKEDRLADKLSKIQKIKSELGEV
ncbi:MAG: hypothetical protein AABX28_00135 [Nanoarchaeota archaeon]